MHGIIQQVEIAVLIVVVGIVGAYLAQGFAAGKRAAEQLLDHVRSQKLRDELKHEVDVLYPVIATQGEKTWADLSGDLKAAAVDGSISRSDWQKLETTFVDDAKAAVKAVGGTLLGQIKHVTDDWIVHAATGQLARKVQASQQDPTAATIHAEANPSSPPSPA